MQICYDEQPEDLYISKEHMCACWLQHEFAPKVDIMKGYEGTTETKEGRA